MEFFSKSLMLLYTSSSCLMFSLNVHGHFLFGDIFFLGEKQSDKGRSVSVCIGKRTLLNQLPVLDWEKHKESLSQSQAILKRNRQSLVTKKETLKGKNECYRGQFDIQLHPLISFYNKFMKNTGDTCFQKNWLCSQAR